MIFVCPDCKNPTEYLHRGFCFYCAVKKGFLLFGKGGECWYCREWNPVLYKDTNVDSLMWCCPKCVMKRGKENMSSKFICSECGAHVDSLIAGWCMDCVKSRRANAVFTSHQTCSKCRKDFSVSRYVGDAIPYPFVCLECQDAPKPRYFCIISLGEDGEKNMQVQEFEEDFGEQVAYILTHYYSGYLSSGDPLEPDDTKTFVVFRCEPITIEMEVSYKVKS